METMLSVIENFIYLHEKSAVTKRYKLTKEECLFLHGSSVGYDIVELMEYFDKKKTYIYKMRDRIIKKFKARNFNEVMYVFGQLQCKKALKS